MRIAPHAIAPANRGLLTLFSPRARLPNAHRHEPNVRFRQGRPPVTCDVERREFQVATQLRVTMGQRNTIGERALIAPMRLSVPLFSPVLVIMSSRAVGFVSDPAFRLAADCVPVSAFDFVGSFHNVWLGRSADGCVRGWGSNWLSFVLVVLADRRPHSDAQSRNQRYLFQSGTFIVAESQSCPRAGQANASTAVSASRNRLRWLSNR